MPSCTFYAALDDFKPVLQFVFGNLSCRVLEAYSDIDTDLKEFFSADDAESACGPGPLFHHLMLWPIEASDEVRMRRIELYPEVGLGRYRCYAEGWGLISLALYGVGSKGLCPSYTGDNSEKRARIWVDTYPEMGDPSLWDWSVVTRASAKLNRRIHSLATIKLGSRPVLPGAKKLIDEGIQALPH